MEKIAAASAPRAEFKKYREMLMHLVTSPNLSQEPIEEVGPICVRYYDRRYKDREPHSTVARSAAARTDGVHALSKT